MKTYINFLFVVLFSLAGMLSAQNTVSLAEQGGVETQKNWQGSACQLNPIQVITNYGAGYENKIPQVGDLQNWLIHFGVVEGFPDISKEVWENKGIDWKHGPGTQKALELCEEAVGQRLTPTLCNQFIESWCTKSPSPVEVKRKTNDSPATSVASRGGVVGNDGYMFDIMGYNPKSQTYYIRKDTVPYVSQNQWFIVVYDAPHVLPLSSVESHGRDDTMNVPGSLFVTQEGDSVHVWEHLTNTGVLLLGVEKISLIPTYSESDEVRLGGIPHFKLSPIRGLSSNDTARTASGSDLTGNLIIDDSVAVKRALLDRRISKGEPGWMQDTTIVEGVGDDSHWMSPVEIFEMRSLDENPDKKALFNMLSARSTEELIPLFTKSVPRNVRSVFRRAFRFVLSKEERTADSLAFDQSMREMYGDSTVAEVSRIDSVATVDRLEHPMKKMITLGSGYNALPWVFHSKGVFGSPLQQITPFGGIVVERALRNSKADLTVGLSSTQSLNEFAPLWGIRSTQVTAGVKIPLADRTQVILNNLVHGRTRALPTGTFGIVVGKYRMTDQYFRIYYGGNQLQNIHEGGIDPADSLDVVVKTQGWFVGLSTGVQYADSFCSIDVKLTTLLSRNGYALLTANWQKKFGKTKSFEMGPSVWMYQNDYATSKWDGGVYLGLEANKRFTLFGREMCVGLYALPEPNRFGQALAVNVFNASADRFLLHHEGGNGVYGARFGLTF